MELEGTVTNWLQGLSELDLRPAKLTAQDSGLLAEGARVTALGITPNDLVTTRFQFDLESQSLRLVQYQIATNVGVFHGRFFARNVTQQPVVTSGGNTVPDYTWFSLAGTNIVINPVLEVGHVFNYGLRNQDREFSLEVLDPEGQQMKLFNGAANVSIVADGTPVIRSGTYQIRIRPRNVAPGTSMSCGLYHANNNRTTLRQVVHGDFWSAALRQNTHDYAKFSMTLTRGQVVRLPTPAAGIGFLILDPRSRALAEPN